MAKCSKGSLKSAVFTRRVNSATEFDQPRPQTANTTGTTLGQDWWAIIT